MSQPPSGSGRSSSSHPVEEITVSLAGLTISGDNNQINLVVASSSRPSPGGSGSDSAAASSAPRPAGRAPRRRWYVIARSPRQPELRGLWHCEWAYLEAKLPGGRLFGSGCKPCKGFDAEGPARQLWDELQPEVAPELHVQP